jgi:SAM-dependent methyltransferase
MSAVRAFINANVALARATNLLLPKSLCTDGNFWFQQKVLADACLAGETVFDIGGGSRPWITPAERQRLGLYVVGLDISAAELAAAPVGSYDEAIAADLCSYVGKGDADVVICQALLEHVPDANGALRAIASALKPGGRAYIFAPCRYAVFAQLNRVLDQDLKRRVLFFLFPYAAEGHDGFVAYYDHCSPNAVKAIVHDLGLSVEQSGTFWVSGYFYFFFPAYLLWRAYQFFSWIALGRDACESFYYVLRKD